MIRTITSILACLALLGGCGGDEGEGNDGGETSAEPSGNGPGDPTPAANAAPRIFGTPVTRIWEEDGYVFAPSAMDPDGDALTFIIANRPRWVTFDATTGRLQGSPSAADVGSHAAVRIGVSDGDVAAWLPPFDIAVEPVSRGSITLTWVPPSENVDDSLLDDLAGFNIYWGNEPEDLTHSTNVTGAGISSHLVDGLSPGRYYFATTAYNSGGVESALSDFAIVVVR
jgi:hypothetical protein